MNLYGDPAALGGVVTGLMLASWMLGRWQGRPGGARASVADEALRETGEAPSGARLCETAARAERRAAADAFAGLGELHADVSAYRQSQQILSDTALQATMKVGWTASGEGELCRFVGVSGERTCPAGQVSADDAPCACSADNAVPGADLPTPPAAAIQPTAEPVVFTRV